jgi:DNA adenine methylase
MKIIKNTASVDEQITSPITYWGGKKLMARHIVPLIPQHEIYVEGFFGGGAIYFAKDKSKVEIINDTNHFVVNFFIQIKSNFEALSSKIQATPFSRGLYKDALVMYDNPHLFDDIERAWAFWILCNQGYSGKIGSWGYGTKENKSELRITNNRNRFTDVFEKRLELTQIENIDAVRLIELRDRPQTFFYLDPPYFNSNMGHYAGYTEADFERLLKVLSKIEGKFLLSTYPSEILDRYVKENGWEQLFFNQVINASSNKKMKCEVLTANYKITK